MSGSVSYRIISILFFTRFAWVTELQCSRLIQTLYVIWKPGVNVLPIRGSCQMRYRKKETNLHKNCKQYDNTASPDELHQIDKNAFLRCLPVFRTVNLQELIFGNVDRMCNERFFLKNKSARRYVNKSIQLSLKSKNAVSRASCLFVRDGRCI